MNEFLIDFAISTVFVLVKGLVKDTKKREQYKRVFLKLRDSINVAYGNDAEFFAVAEIEETPKPKKRK